MSDAEVSVGELREQVRRFVQERDWEQFHNAKDLAVAIAVEAAELMELFLWKAPEDVAQAVAEPDTRGRVEEELADVLILCLSLANSLEVDVTTVVSAKLRANAAKYPADQARGSAAKYTAYRPG